MEIQTPICANITLKPVSVPDDSYVSPLVLTAAELVPPRTPRSKPAARPVGHVMPPLVLEPLFVMAHL